ncbi:unnamed protein product [Heligmosomoides polygyrus]|uniref:EGF-like domain-containing protein n=1 Tax=Heligmosomoides polygyrus TaxID=6339 RepID=A0A3P8AWM8_HELPZ|nr:unnamed protein product [Heligmosomoides polygyrus]
MKCCTSTSATLKVTPLPIQASAAVLVSVVNECSEARLNDCSPNARCVDKAIGYSCRCVPGFADTSPARARRPGRVCTALVNECTTRQHDCDPSAVCRDEAVGFRCHCPFGFADASPEPSKPGRLCLQSELEQLSSAAASAEREVCQ